MARDGVTTNIRTSYEGQSRRRSTMARSVNQCPDALAKRCKREFFMPAHQSVQEKDDGPLSER